MRPHRARFLSLGAAALMAVALAAGCSSSNSGSSSGGSTNKSPILIGASLSLTGDFSADGQAFQKGYNLWVHDVNASGGLNGRKVQLVVLNDNSSPTQVNTNYQALITVHHVNLTFGPFSSLLTAPAALVAHRYGYAFIEGAGGSELVFSEKLPNVFDVSLPVAAELNPLIDWISSMPASQRPATAAYPKADDPFAIPQTVTAQGKIQPMGVKTVYSKIFPAEVPDYKPNADAVAAAGAQMVVLGSTDVPTVQAFMQAFEQQHYNPKIFVATAGPDQGAAFTSAVGVANANGMMVPNGWYPSLPNAASMKMVNEYVAKYGGSPSDVNADVAEAYAVGEVAAQAVTHVGGPDNSKIISYLHSGVTLSSVQGPVQFNSLGQNVKAIAFLFQWQNGKYVQVLPVGATNSVAIINPKPKWSS
jgi:branched-chain amino acid transport system substrate-binding protein